MNLNKAIVIGRVTRDPEARTTPSGQTVCNIGIATNRIWNNQNNERQEATEFHNIVLWRRLAEIASQYLKKGSLVLTEGRLQTRSWEDQSGVKKYRTEIVAESMQLGPKSSNANFSSSAPSQTDFTSNKPASAENTSERNKEKEDDIPIIEENSQEDKEINVEDIPF